MMTMCIRLFILVLYHLMSLHVCFVDRSVGQKGNVDNFSMSGYHHSYNKRDGQAGGTRGYIADT